MSDHELPRLDALHSPASTLPADILSLIFQHACTIPDLNERYGLPDPSLSSPPPRGKRTQFILSAVSVYWRQVSTLLTPYIWTSVDLIMSPSTVSEASAILQAFLTYSGQLPLAIAIEFPGLWKYDTKVLVDTPSDTLLYQNAHRIRELYLCGLPYSWNDLLPSLSNLAHLSIDRRFACGFPPVPVMIKSQCSNLTLKTFPRRVQLSCSEITVLHLYEVPVNFCINILMTCPNLIEFRALVVAEGEEGEIILPRDSFFLPYMEVFGWPVSTSSSTDVAMLRHIRLPALRELVWVEEDRGSFDTMDPRITFFRNLPSTLTGVHIVDARVGRNPSVLPASVFDYVRELPSIECLTLSGVSSGFVDHVFERLTPTLENNGSQQLPKLKAIRIKGDYTSTEFSQDRILQMLGRRFLDAGALNQEPFRLEFPPYVVLLARFKEKLKEMIGHGLKVEIFEGVEPVDWL